MFPNNSLHTDKAHLQAFRSPTLNASLEGTLRQLSAQLADDGGLHGPQQQQLAETTAHLRHLCLLMFLLHTRDELASTIRRSQVI